MEVPRKSIAGFLGIQAVINILGASVGKPHSCLIVARSATRINRFRLHAIVGIVEE